MTELVQPPALDPTDDDALPELASLRLQVEARLASLLEDEAERWCRVDPSFRAGFDLLVGFIANGGKRLRPSFCLLAHLGTGGSADDRRAVDLAAALELLHTFALVHDDVMDGSATRRHAPTVHCSLAETHRRRGWRGERRRFAEGMAVLLGDLAFAYSDRLLLDMPPAVTHVFDELRIELHVGQYLDLLAAATGGGGLERATTVMRYKTAAYSVERPLQLGAALAGGLESRREAMSGFGLAVGEAFQLRDDVLGAFGEPAVTGKPLGDDFREGKRTVLLHLAEEAVHRSGSDDDRALLGRVGDPDLTAGDVDSLQALLRDSGALGAVERRIAERMREAERLLGELALTDPAAAALWALAMRCAWRDR